MTNFGSWAGAASERIAQRLSAADMCAVTAKNGRGRTVRALFAPAVSFYFALRDDWGIFQNTTTWPASRAAQQRRNSLPVSPMVAPRGKRLPTTTPSVVTSLASALRVDIAVAFTRESSRKRARSPLSVAALSQHASCRSKTPQQPKSGLRRDSSDRLARAHARAPPTAKLPTTKLPPDGENRHPLLKCEPHTVMRIRTTASRFLNFWFAPQPEWARAPV